MKRHFSIFYTKWKISIEFLTILQLFPHAYVLEFDNVLIAFSQIVKQVYIMSTWSLFPSFLNPFLSFSTYRPLLPSFLFSLTLYYYEIGTRVPESVSRWPSACTWIPIREIEAKARDQCTTKHWNDSQMLIPRWNSLVDISKIYLFAWMSEIKVWFLL